MTAPTWILSLISGLVLTTVAAHAGVYKDNSPGKWKDGRVTWKYNPASRPSTLTDQQVIDHFTRAFGWWANVCRISASYGGTTTTSIYATPGNELIVGFDDNGPDDATIGGSAQGAPYSNDAASAYAFYTGGGIRVQTRGAYNFLNNPYVVAHEVGHVLGFDHSDDPASIMFANPYFALNNQAENIVSYTAGTPGPLFGDDMEVCGNLYGSNGMFTVTDHSKWVADSSLGLTSDISSTVPTFTPATSVSQINPGVDNYFALRINGLTGRAPATMTLRLVMPSGRIYSGFSAVATGDGYNYLTAKAGTLPLAGQWQFQGLLDGKLGTARTFTVPSGVVTQPAKLEYAAIVEQAGAGISQRVVNYSSVGIAYANVYLNDNYGAVNSVAAPLAGSNHLDFWVKSNLPRYPLNLPNNQGGQADNSADALKSVVFSLANGVLSGSGIDIAEMGTQMAYSARANIQASGAGTQGVYIAALLGGQWVFRHESGWNTTATPLFTFSGPGAVNLDILRSVDTRQIPSGTLLFVGYGRSLTEVTANNQYKLVRSF